MSQLQKRQTERPGSRPRQSSPRQFAQDIADSIQRGAVTDENGEFEIKNLPAGKHTFQIWQEAAGYVDEVKQDGNTGEMIFNIFEQISYLSMLMTLQPGDLIATGTPAGVGMGSGTFLKPGNVMRASIEGIGDLENPVDRERV